MTAQSAAAGVLEGSRKTSWSRVLVRIRPYMMVIALAVIWVFFGLVTQGTYLSARNMSLLLRQMSILGIAATGMVMMLIMAQIDLSVGATFALFAGITAILEAYHAWGTAPAILVALAGGVVLGAFHGWIISALNRPFAAFPITLGGMLAWRGLENLLSGGIVVSPINESHEFLGSGYLSMPLSFGILAVTCLAAIALTANSARTRQNWGQTTRSRWLAQNLALVAVFAAYMAYVISFKGMPVGVLIMLAIGVVFHFITRRTTFGRHLYAIGGNREAAQLSGINIRKTTFIAFVLMGLLYAIGGVIFVGRLGVAEPQMGTYLEMDAIAACVIGGAAMAGGEGTVLGALLGALVIGSLDNGMSVLAVSTFSRYVVKGIVLLLAVFADGAARRYQR